jgi:glutathione S-transferase
VNRNLLILGSPYSSTWSMRAFLCAHPIIDDFEINWKEFDANSKLMDTTLCPTNQVPVLYLANLQKPIVETFAIAEVLSELGGLSWPKDRSDRWYAKSLCLEFQNQANKLRELIPMDLRDGKNLSVTPKELDEWDRRLSDLLDTNHTQFLFGEISVVDAWFAPLLCRFVRVNYEMSPSVAAYYDRMIGTDGWKEWTSKVTHLDVRYASQ